MKLLQLFEINQLITDEDEIQAWCDRNVTANLNGIERHCNITQMGFAELPTSVEVYPKPTERSQFNLYKFCDKTSAGELYMPVRLSSIRRLVLDADKNDILNFVGFPGMVSHFLSIQNLGHVKSWEGFPKVEPLMTVNLSFVEDVDGFTDFAGHHMQDLRIQTLMGAKIKSLEGLPMHLTSLRLNTTSTLKDIDMICPFLVSMTIQHIEEPISLIDLAGIKQLAFISTPASNESSELGKAINILQDMINSSETRETNAKSVFTEKLFNAGLKDWI